MEKTILKALVREERGKNACKHMRRDGQIPAVVYKDGKPGISVRVGSKDLWHALHTEAGENAIITMDISGGDKPLQKTVIVKARQLEPLNDEFLHLDFQEISLKEKLKVKVPLTVKGEAKGVQEEEGVLAQLEWEIEVECLPTDIPEYLEVHVDELMIGDSLHVSDVEAPQGVAILNDPEQVVVQVNQPMAEEEVVEEVEGEEGAEEPEVIKKGKGEEEEGEEGAAEEGGKEAPQAEEGKE
ncbi:50S ribosomal protein L25 [Candidatus Omnitrophota bacterium]